MLVSLLLQLTKFFVCFDVTYMLNCFKLFLIEYGYHLSQSLMIALTDFSVLCTTIVCQCYWCVRNLLVFSPVGSCGTNCLLELIWGNYDKLEYRNPILICYS